MKLKFLTFLVVALGGQLSWAAPCVVDLNQDEMIEKVFRVDERSGSSMMKLEVHTNEKTITMVFPSYGANNGNSESFQAQGFLNHCLKLAQLHRQGLVSGTLGYAFGACTVSNGNYEGYLRFSYTVSNHRASGVCYRRNESGMVVDSFTLGDSAPAINN